MTAYVTEVCQNCGNLRSVCSDPSRTLYPQRSICYPTAVRDVAYRLVYAKYGRPDPKSGDMHITDGMAIWASEHDLTPDDNFV